MQSTNLLVEFSRRSTTVVPKQGTSRCYALMMIYATCSERNNTGASALLDLHTHNTDSSLCTRSLAFAQTQNTKPPIGQAWCSRWHLSVTAATTAAVQYPLRTALCSQM
eukprot:19860-Heterococcus_DN1.PRE.3